MDATKRFAMSQHGMRMTLFQLFSAGTITQSESKHRLTRGGRKQHLPGGLRGMSQRQYRKRVRQGVK